MLSAGKTLVERLPTSKGTSLSSIQSNRKYCSSILRLSETLFVKHNPGFILCFFCFRFQQADCKGSQLVHLMDSN